MGLTSTDKSPCLQECFIFTAIKMMAMCDHFAFKYYLENP